MTGRPPTVVVASDAFKGSLTSLEVADAVRLGVLDVARTAAVVVVPVVDGGEGTVAAALAAGWSAVPVEAHGPTGDPVNAPSRFALDDTDLTALGVRTAYPLSDLEPDPQRSMTDAADLLRRTARRIAQKWLSPPPW